MNKFKKGDKVRCVTNHGDQFTVGKIYTIRRDDTGWCSVVEDNNHEENGLSAVFFELIESHITPEEVQFINKISEEYTASKTGTKNDAGKPSITLIPKDAIWGMAQALTFGAEKYGRHNFRNGIAFSRLADAAQRHLTAWMEGENQDLESKLSHLDHAMASLAMLKFMDVNRSDMDDRWLNPVHQDPEKGIVLGSEELYERAKEIQKRGR